MRNLEEMMAERGVIVDHATVHRWALKMLPVLAAVFRARKRSVGSSWRVDETYIRVGGQWKYLYRAVDQLGQTVDFLLTAARIDGKERRSSTFARSKRFVDVDGAQGLIGKIKDACVRNSIQRCLMLRSAFKRAPRQAEGLMSSIIELLGCELAVPHEFGIDNRSQIFEARATHTLQVTTR